MRSSAGLSSVKEEKEVGDVISKLALKRVETGLLLIAGLNFPDDVRAAKGSFVAVLLLSSSLPHWEGA